MVAAAVIRDEHKLIVYYGDPNRYELYDLASDPSELVNRSGDLADRLGVLSAELVQRLNADGSRMAIWSDVYEEIPDERKKKLRSLGYIE